MFGDSKFSRCLQTLALKSVEKGPFWAMSGRVVSAAGAGRTPAASRCSALRVRPRLLQRQNSSAHWRSKICGTRRPHGIHEEDPIEEHVSRLAARLRDQQAAVAGGAVQHPVIISSHWVMICTDRIARAQALSFKGRLQNSGEPMCDFDEAAEGTLISGGGRVDQDATLDRLSGQIREKIYALLQGAGGVAAVD